MPRGILFIRSAISERKKKKKKKKKKCVHGEDLCQSDHSLKYLRTLSFLRRLAVFDAVDLSPIHVYITYNYTDHSM